MRLSVQLLFGSHPAANPHEYWILWLFAILFLNNQCSTNGRRGIRARKSLEIQIQNGQKFGHLGPGQSGEGTEGAVSVALKEALGHSPAHGRLGVILHLAAVCKGRQVCPLDSFLLQVLGDIPGYMPAFPSGR